MYFPSFLFIEAEVPKLHLNSLIALDMPDISKGTDPRYMKMVCGREHNMFRESLTL